MKFLSHLILQIALVLFLGTSVQAGMKNAKNGEWVTLTGEVTHVSAQAFKLKMNDKTVLIEMDDWDWDADGYKLVKGDKVVVRGRVDKDFLEKKKVEAGSVYVKGLDTYFYASAADEEGPVAFNTSYFVLSPLAPGAVYDIIGTVEKVDGREFVVNTGWRKVRVDTNEMAFNPTDDKGFLKITKGDLVRVSGIMTNEFWDDGKELSARYIVDY